MTEKEIRKKVKEFEKKSLSGEDVLNLCGKRANLLTYPELAKLDNIDQLLGKYRAAIILYLTSENYGHWVCLFQQDKKTLCFFDSYALMPDDELKFTQINFRLSHNQYYPHLTYLLYNSGYDVDYNSYKLQSDKKDTTTCGRWVGARLAMRRLTNDEFAKLFLNSKSKPDELVTALTAFL